MFGLQEYVNFILLRPIFAEIFAKSRSKSRSISRSTMAAALESRDQQCYHSLDKGYGVVYQTRSAVVESARFWFGLVQTYLKSHFKIFSDEYWRRNSVNHNLFFRFSNTFVKLLFYSRPRSWNFILGHFENRFAKPIVHLRYDHSWSGNRSGFRSGCGFWTA